MCSTVGIEDSDFSKNYFGKNIRTPSEEYEPLREAFSRDGQVPGLLRIPKRSTG